MQCARFVHSVVITTAGWFHPVATLLFLQGSFWEETDIAGVGETGLDEEGLLASDQFWPSSDVDVEIEVRTVLLIV